MANTSRMGTTTSPGHLQPWTAVSALLGLMVAVTTSDVELAAASLASVVPVMNSSPSFTADAPSTSPALFDSSSSQPSRVSESTVASPSLPPPSSTLRSFSPSTSPLKHANALSLTSRVKDSSRHQATI